MYSSLEENKLTLTDSFTAYTPKKYQYPPHPSKIVEATSLAFGNSPQINYKLNLLNSPHYIRNSLSCVQLEAISLAFQKFSEFTPENFRKGFFLGDSAGLGKGRTIAGMFLENYVQYKGKGIWVTVSTDLFTDCQRDLEAVSDSLKLVKLRPTFDFKIGKIPNEAIVCITYATLCRDGKKKKDDNTRINHIIDWFTRHNEGEGLIVFDESHRGKGFYKTRIGYILQRLQDLLPKACVLYSTATAASNPYDFVYMNRLGLWPISNVSVSLEKFMFKSTAEFFSEIERRGISAMESLAIEMKNEGLLISRMLSFQDVENLMIEAELSSEFMEMYDQSCVLWANLYGYLKSNHPQGRSKKYMSMFWSNHLNFFQTLITSAKVVLAADFAKKRAINNGESVVFGLQKTGDSQYNILAKKKITTMNRSFSHAASILAFVMEKIFDIDVYHLFEAKKDEVNKYQLISDEKEENFTTGSDEDSESDFSSSSDSDNELSIKRSKNEELNKIVSQFEALYKLLPQNPIDYLINDLGGPTAVAELTGRKNRCVFSYENEEYKNSSRKKHTTDRESNLKEIENFQCGAKKFAIISDAASTGVSLHCEKSSSNTSKRVHITLECAYSAEKYIQQLGRTHRSNQLTAPLYVFILSSIPAEDRFIWGISDKLSKLGAITKGDRNCTQTFYELNKSLNSFYGEIALKQLIIHITTGSILNYFSNFSLKDVRNWLSNLGVIDMENSHRKNGKKNAISRFLNRILNCPIKLQREILEAFYKFLDDAIKIALENKTFNAGVLEYKIPDSATASILNELEFQIKGYQLIYYALEIDNGFSWSQLIKYAENLENIRFLVYKKQRAQILFAYTQNRITYVIQPSYCQAVPLSTLSAMQFDSKKQSTIAIDKTNGVIDWPDVAKEFWDQQFEFMSSGACIHMFTNKACFIKNCNAGSRLIFQGMLSGSLNTVWKIIEKHLEKKQFPLVRIVCKDDDKKIVGVLFDNHIGEKMTEIFEKLSQE